MDSPVPLATIQFRVSNKRTKGDPPPGMTSYIPMCSQLIIHVASPTSCHLLTNCYPSWFLSAKS